MKGSISTGLAAVAMVALALAASAEDLTISARITSRAGSSITTAYISETADRTTNGDLTVIVDYASGRKLTVDAGKKEYSETSFREMAEREAQLEKLFAEFRRRAGAAARNRRRGARKKQAVRVEKGSAARRIAGYDTEHWTIDAGAVKCDVWMAPALHVPPVPPAYHEAAKAYSIAGAATGGLARVYEEIGRLPGVLLARRCKVDEGEQIESRAEAIEVKKGPIPAALFQVPAGFKKTEARANWP